MLLPKYELQSNIIECLSTINCVQCYLHQANRDTDSLVYWLVFRIFSHVLKYCKIFTLFYQLPTFRSDLCREDNENRGKRKWLCQAN